MLLSGKLPLEYNKMINSFIDKMSLVLILSFLAPLVVLSQDLEEEEGVFRSVEEPPEFPGGRDSLRQFLNANLKYPYDDKMSGREGKILIAFVVEKDGSFSNVRFVLELEPKPTDQMVDEALRVFNLMPKWTPGKQRGKVVRARHELPITFAFYKGKKEKKSKRRRP